MREQRPGLRPLDVDAAPVIAVGTLLWVVALVVVLVAGAPSTARWTCGCGIALGLVGVPLARRMQRPKSR